MTYCDPDYLLRGRKIKRLVEYSCENLRREYDLKQIEIDVLAYLAMHPDTTAHVIVNTLDLHKGQLSAALNRLIRLGYAAEYHDPDDHRYVHYEATKKSRQLIQAILSEKKKIKEQIFKGFTAEEVDELHRLMQKMSANVDEMINMQ